MKIQYLTIKMESFHLIILPQGLKEEMIIHLGLQLKAFLSISSENERCNLSIKIDEKTEMSFYDSDFFSCLNKIRIKLYQDENLFPMCKGALINVYPSRMSKQMSKGLKAYSYELGNQAGEKKLINIFDDIDELDISNLSTVDEQLNHFKIWLKSL